MYPMSDNKSPTNNNPIDITKSIVMDARTIHKMKVMARQTDRSESAMVRYCINRVWNELVEKGEILDPPHDEFSTIPD